MQDTIKIEGTIYVYEVPWETKAETALYLPKMSKREKDKLLVARGKNLLTNAGKSLVLTFLGTPGAMSANTQYAEIFSLGSGVIAGVQATDTSVVGEYSTCRQAPDGFTVIAPSTTITTTYTGSNGNASISNCGLYGENASTTNGTGTLHNHALITYSKGTGTSVFVYVLT